MMTSNTISTRVPVQISTLRCWLSSLLDGQVSPWEVTPETTAILTELYTRNVNMEADTEVVTEVLKTARAEYEGEKERLDGILTAAGPGVMESMRQGPAQSHADNLVGVCSSLRIDTCSGSGLQIALSELLVNQANDLTEVSKQRSDVDSLKANVVGLYEKLSRSKEELEKASEVDREQNSVTARYNQKVEFLSKKSIEYKRNIEKKEALLAKNGGNDPSIKHSEIVNLKDRLLSREEELKPLSRQLQGFLSLPPSVDMARMEVAKSELELENLDKQLTGSISDLHL